MRQIPVLHPPPYFDIWGTEEKNPDTLKGKRILMQISALLEELPSGWSIEVSHHPKVISITPGQIEADVSEEF
jgi:hypothetical protein